VDLLYFSNSRGFVSKAGQVDLLYFSNSRGFVSKARQVNLLEEVIKIKDKINSYLFLMLIYVFNKSNICIIRIKDIGFE